MSIFRQTLQEDCAALDLCIRVASLMILRTESAHGKEYQQSDADQKRVSSIIAGLKTYIHQCGTRKASNLDSIEKGKYLARVHEIGKIDYLQELNRVRDYASTGEWTARQFLPGPEPYERVTLEEIDATIEKIENQLTAKGMA